LNRDQTTGKGVSLSGDLTVYSILDIHSSCCRKALLRSVRPTNRQHQSSRHAM